MNNKIQEIRKRAELASQGGWQITSRGLISQNGKRVCQMYEDYGVETLDYENLENNILFVRAAPEYIAYLLSEYDRLQAENERFRQALNKICAKASEDRMSNIAFEALHEDGDKK